MELFPHLSALPIEEVERQPDKVVLRTRVRAAAAVCQCGRRSARVHGRYVRKLRDVAVGGLDVVIELCIRRFRCENSAYSAVAFAEQIYDGREGEDLAVWLRDHPEVKVICRDRSSGYSEGARVGAPQAEQVADRYHLWANLGQAVKKTVKARRSRLAEPPSEPADAPGEPRVVQPLAELKFVTRLREQHVAAHELWQQGMSKAAIGRKLGLHQATVRKLVNAPSADDVVAKSLSVHTSSTRTSPTCTDAGTKASETPLSSAARSRNRDTLEASWPSSVICAATGPGADTHPPKAPSLHRYGR
ncbi:transposase family protein [Streptomyces sp. NPDC056500]|uniref:transposase family protein n=1 Tax=Streptomyces sp. NPDC056500 TaxID=3345840 RepID=UPI00367F0CDF